MPDAVELLVLCVHAGRSPHQAIAELAARAPPAVRRAFAAVELQLHRGRSLADALGELPRLLGSARARRRRGDRHRRPRRAAARRRCSTGWPTEARAARRRLGEAEARRLPVRLTFPLVTLHAPVVRPARHRAGRARRPLDAAAPPRP